MAKSLVAVVIQGPHYGEDTRMVIREFLDKNENILPIISSYHSDEGMINDWEKQLIRDGKAEYIFSYLPLESDTDFWGSNFANQNLQRLTSYVGLQRARILGIEYALKIRSDTFFGKKEIISELLELLCKYPVSAKDPSGRGPKDPRGRLIVSGHATMSDPQIVHLFPPYHIRDHWYFGYTKDLIKFFDLDSPTWAGGSGIMQHSPESSLTQVWMKDLGIEVADIEELLARYFIVMDFEQVEQFRTHFPEKEKTHWEMNLKDFRNRRAEYLVEYLSKVENPLFFTSHRRWQELVRL